MNKISHSAYKKYLTCPRLYKLHYVDKLRPIGTSSSLLFGSAIDEALNCLLLKTDDPLEVFKREFTYEKCQGIQWHKDDLDTSIFSSDQLYKVLDTDYDYQCWASLRIKGRMLIEKYIEEILPRISKVHEVQRELEGRRGFVDVVAEFDGEKVLIDHKTASRPYMYNATASDTQLCLYAHHLGLDKIGFIVLNKRINRNSVKICKKCKYNGTHVRHKTCPQEVDGKRCHGTWEETTAPEAKIQVIIDRVPEAYQSLTMQSIGEVEHGIQQKVFPANLNACDKMYGKPCPYKEYCLYGKTEGLKKEIK